MKYAIVELQKFQDGTLAHLYTTRDNLSEALSEYHRVMAAVAVSGLDAHSVAVIDEDGNVCRTGNNKEV